MAPGNITNISALTDGHNGDEDSGAAWIPFVEPVPDYDEAMATYGIWWHFHIYSAAALFLLVALFSLWNMVYLLHLHRQKELRNVQQTAFFFAINIIMLFFSLERAVFMILDAYNIRGSMSAIVAYLFISIGLPCMTSCFCLIFYAFYKASGSRIVGRSIISIKVLVGIIFLHFSISLSLDIAAGLNIYPLHLLMTCMCLFILTAGMIASMFILLFHRIYKQSVIQRRRMLRIASLCDQPTEPPAGVGNISSSVKNPALGISRTQKSLMTMPQPEVTIGGKLILASAILLIIIALLYLFGLVCVFGSNVILGVELDLWLWWGCEYAIRLLEVCLCWTISLAATQPVMRSLRKKRSTKRRKHEQLLAERRRSEASVASSVRENSEKRVLKEKERLATVDDVSEVENTDVSVSSEKVTNSMPDVLPADCTMKKEFTNGDSNDIIMRDSNSPPTIQQTEGYENPDVEADEDDKQLSSSMTDIDAKESA